MSSTDFYSTILYVLLGLFVVLFGGAYVVVYGSNYLTGASGILKIVAAFAAVFIIIWSAFVLFRPASSVSLQPYKGPLSKETVVGTSADLIKNFYNGVGGGSFGVYIYLANYDRSTVDSASYAKPLIKIGGSAFYVNNDGAYLQITTNGGVEKISLDHFPTQKWVHVIINREGRRYTVYYNGVVAGSKNIVKMYKQTTDAIRIGATSYIGTFVYPLLNSSILHEDEIKAYIKKTANTRGEPYLPTDFLSTLSQMVQPCTGGDCSQTVKPPSGKVWSI